MSSTDSATLDHYRPSRHAVSRKSNKALIPISALFGEGVSGLFVRHHEGEQHSLAWQLVLRVDGVGRLVVGHTMGSHRGWHVGDELAIATQDGHLAAAIIIGAGYEELVRLGVVDVSVASPGLIDGRSHLAGLEVPDRQVLALGVAAAKHGDIQRRVDSDAIGIALIADVHLL